jgi:hypothetical protein
MISLKIGRSAWIPRWSPSLDLSLAARGEIAQPDQQTSRL